MISLGILNWWTDVSWTDDFIGRITWIQLRLSHASLLMPRRSNSQTTTWRGPTGILQNDFTIGSIGFRAENARRFGCAILFWPLVSLKPSSSFHICSYHTSLRSPFYRLVFTAGPVKVPSARPSTSERAPALLGSPVAQTSQNLWATLCPSCRNTQPANVLFPHPVIAPLVPHVRHLAPALNATWLSSNRETSLKAFFCANGNDLCTTPPPCLGAVADHQSPWSPQIRISTATLVWWNDAVRTRELIHGLDPSFHVIQTMYDILWYDDIIWYMFMYMFLEF